MAVDHHAHMWLSAPTLHMPLRIQHSLQLVTTTGRFLFFSTSGDSHPFLGPLDLLLTPLHLRREWTHALTKHDLHTCMPLDSHLCHSPHLTCSLTPHPHPHLHMLMPSSMAVHAHTCPHHSYTLAYASTEPSSMSHALYCTTTALDGYPCILTRSITKWSPLSIYVEWPSDLWYHHFHLSSSALMIFYFCLMLSHP